MKKVIKLTESDLYRIIKRVISEGNPTRRPSSTTTQRPPETRKFKDKAWYEDRLRGALSGFLSQWKEKMKNHPRYPNVSFKEIINFINIATKWKKYPEYQRLDNGWRQIFDKLLESYDMTTKLYNVLGSENKATSFLTKFDLKDVNTLYRDVEGLGEHITDLAARNEPVT